MFFTISQDVIRIKASLAFTRFHTRHLLIAPFIFLLTNRFHRLDFNKSGCVELTIHLHWAGIHIFEANSRLGLHRWIETINAIYSISGLRLTDNISIVR